ADPGRGGTVFSFTDPSCRSVCSMKSALKVFSLLGLVVATLHGCSSGASDVPPLGTVTGKVTLDDQPYAGVRVIFQPVEGGRTSDAMTGEDGRYRLIYSTTEYGAKVGMHRVHFENDVDLGGTA